MTRAVEHAIKRLIVKSTKPKKDPTAVALGRKRWKGVSKADRAAYGRMMVAAREKKRRAKERAK